MPDAFALLRRIHLFAGLTDDELRLVALKLKYQEHGPNEAIFHQGDASQAFYIVQSGTVAVVRAKGTQEQVVTKLAEGDYFGEMELIYGRRRSAGVQTVTQAGLWRLDTDDFDALLREFPQIKLNFAVALNTRRRARSRHFKWLEPEEIVYLIAAKHESLFMIKIQPGIFGLILGLVAVWAGWHYLATMLAWYLFLPVALVSLGWLIWQYVDWHNDLYIVTNKRAVDYEKIALIYDSRNEAPLSTVRNVSLATDQMGRILGYGNVTINTYSGPITFRSVPYPQAVADLIQEQINRQRARAALTDRQALKRSLRQSMGLESPVSAQTSPITPVKPQKPARKEGARLPNPFEQLGGHFTFRVRTEAGEIITYRKHPFVLLQDILLPSAAVIALSALLGLRLAGVILVLELPAFFIAWLIPLAAAAGWWLYEYEDWRNDIYQITPEQILDVSRKPFGQETRKTAAIANILSVKTDRPGLLALALNFGDVIIQTGPGGEMQFRGVFAPLEVQQDIFRRQEARQAKAAADQAAADRDRLAKALGAFYDITVDEQRERLAHKQRALREEAVLVEQKLQEMAERIAVFDEALEQGPRAGLDQLALARLRDSRAGAKEELTVTALRLKSLETELKAVEGDVRRTEEFLEAR